MSLPQARSAVSGAAAFALWGFALTVARGIAPVSVNPRPGASEPYPWNDIDLWITPV